MKIYKLFSGILCSIVVLTNIRSSYAQSEIPSTIQNEINGSIYKNNQPYNPGTTLNVSPANPIDWQLTEIKGSIDRA